jgi:hypothetical protein
LCPARYEQVTTVAVLAPGGLRESEDVLQARAPAPRPGVRGGLAKLEKPPGRAVVAASSASTWLTLALTPPSAPPAQPNYENLTVARHPARAAFVAGFAGAILQAGGPLVPAAAIAIFNVSELVWEVRRGRRWGRTPGRPCDAARVTLRCCRIDAAVAGIGTRCGGSGSPSATASRRPATSGAPRLPLQRIG